MKYIKIFEDFKDIDSICRKYNITNYNINSDGSIDVDGDVNLKDKGLAKLPLRFREVSGDFYCHRNQLTSLEGSPQSVGRDFYCRDNQLTSLEGSPKTVGRDFDCYDNPFFSIWDLFRDYSKVDLFNDYDPIRDNRVIILDRLNAFLHDIGKPEVNRVEGYKCI